MGHPDWQVRLLETLAAWQDAPFRWGQHDCCLSVARCIDAMTGRDTALRLAEHYTDKRGALRYLRQMGGMRLAVESWLGPMRDGVPGRGDVALVPTVNGLGVGVSLGDVVLVASGVGFAAYPPDVAMGRWSVWVRQ